MVVVRVRLIDENHLNAPFPYGVSGIKHGPATLGELASPNLPWGSRMALSHTEKQNVSGTGSHDTVDAVVADE